MTEDKLQKLMNLQGIMAINFVSKVPGENRSIMFSDSGETHLKSHGSQLIEILKTNGNHPDQPVQYVKMEFESSTLWVLNSSGGYLLLEVSGAANNVDKTRIARLADGIAQ